VQKMSRIALRTKKKNINLRKAHTKKNFALKRFCEKRTFDI
jgi:hypothetical protein